MFRRYNARLIFLPLVSSLLVGAAFWVDELWFLVLVALIPLYAAVDRAPWRRGLAATILFVAVSAVGLGYPLLTFRSVQSAEISGGPFFFLMAVGSGYILLLATVALFAVWLPIAHTRLWYFRIAAVPVAWLIFELVQGKLSYGLRWFSLAEPLVAFPPLAVWSRLGGEYLLAGIVIACNIALFEGLRRFSRREPWRSAIPLAAVLACIGTVIAGGWIYIKLTATVAVAPTSRQLRVAVIQRGPLPPPEQRGPFYSDTIRLTREAVRRGSIADADLVIFPGNYFGSLDRAEFEALDVFGAVLGSKPAGAPAALIGFSLFENSERRQVLALVPPEGKREYSAKLYLMPFGDFTPRIVRSVYPTFPDLSGGYVSGTAALLELQSGVKIAAVSCSEQFVADHVRRLAGKGADLIIISGSLGDFRSELVHRKVLRVARLRAVETGIPVVLAMKSGISAIIDPLGRVITSLGKDQQGVLRAFIPLPK